MDIFIDGKNYILVKETDHYLLTNQRGVKNCSVLPEEIIDNFQEYLGKERGKNMCICVLDCCRNIPEWAPDQMRTTPSGGFADMKSRGGTVVLCACAPGKTADDGSGPNSPFTTKVLENLRPGEKPADVFRRVSRALDASTDGKQVTCTCICLFFADLYARIKIQVRWQSINHYPEDRRF